MKQQEIEIRSLHGYDEMLACARLQEEIWGPQDVVSATLLTAIQKGGGVVGGAFEGSGELVGMVLGFSGPRHGRFIHWSHMLGVAEPSWGRGVGRRLKMFQRQEVLGMGIQVMHWTYDPLEARNAHLNLNRLGAIIDEHVRDLYGTGADNKLHDVIGTDRFIVSWHLDSQRVGAALKGSYPAQPSAVEHAPIVSSHTQEDGTITPTDKELVDTDRVRVEIPPDIQTMKRRLPDEAGRWRHVTRRAFEHYLPKGYSVDGFYREADRNRCFYVLIRGGTGENA
jgi:predicted GNAT superfamily acetyltransferase